MKVFIRRQKYYNFESFFFQGLLLFINCASSKWATSMHVLFTALKLFAIFLIIFTGFVRLGQGSVFCSLYYVFMAYRNVSTLSEF